MPRNATLAKSHPGQQFPISWVLAQSIEEGLNSHVGKPTTTFEHGLFRVLEGFIDMAQREHELGEVGGRDVPLGGHPVELIQRGSGSSGRSWRIATRASAASAWVSPGWSTSASRKAASASGYR